MSTYEPNKLLSLWTNQQLNTEMAVGHILQNLVKILQAIETLTLTLYNLRADVDSLIAHTGMKPHQTGKKKPPKQD